METKPEFKKDAKLENKEKLSLRILIADDEKVPRKNVKENLEEMGYTVDEVEDGQLLLDKLATEDYDLVITDHRMPKVKGLEALQKIRAIEKTKNLPVIVFSGGEGIKNEVEKSGGIYCDKLEADHLFATVTKLLEKADK